MRQTGRKYLLAQLIPIVRAAGGAIMAIYRRGSAEVSHKADASPVTEADLAAHRVLATHLAHLLPSYQVVSEEDPMSLVYRQGAGRFWLIDPLDGIKEFIARNGEFTVNIALIEKRRSALGVAYAPAKEGHACLVVASKSHLNEATQAMTDRLGDVSLVQAGSSLKFCRVAEGEADIYHRLAVSGTRRHPGRCWRGRGGAVVDLDGQPLLHGKPDVLNPSFIATRDTTLIPA
ncbi:3'(2'),5'-bisphosphate nucleotidase CysQ [Dechloromonas agitata]|uniref:3'(2'),5'-bisphosphate nucleotidase CysQ family protein n=1 Tax=Dechloromonas agitata TaxID=73030 RepID=UPI00237E8D57|nr:3'(2'),5'-bisphosphate nucleotidase CysQ [Dechloromonas agitata]MDE1546532.1 3'(2'),5'-bisphosphate nucleotidase CysQ [Dechloromonas agitata]